ncbi:MAG: FAD:protein FMN transferase [Desulfobacterales bacterium]|nr:FAD:protein FMN transferase [Desulfobacterales bacterium]
MALCACDLRREHTLTGRTMGTTYAVTVVAGPFGSVEGLQARIDRRLEEINRAISPYRADSEISRFNRFDRVGEEFPISTDFLQVMQVAARLHALGRGLGRDGRPARGSLGVRPRGQPGAGARPGGHRGALAGGRFRPDRDPRQRRAGQAPRQGLARPVLRRPGLRGRPDRRDPARRRVHGLPGRGGRRDPRRGGPSRRPPLAGRHQPAGPGARPEDIFEVVALRDQSFSTSGDYRQFFVQDGVRYSHHIDPATGYPVPGGLVSVSILAGGSCTLVDGLGTAVRVMGVEKRLALVERLEGVAALLVVQAPDGSLHQHLSRRMRLEPAP